ncbi:MAG TPA: biotin--[acetyl-CoA-carboxylase] ligase [bacterium]|nr:biotin--[acetyl-CoA-carboxylase] ligase [bacterium]
MTADPREAGSRSRLIGAVLIRVDRAVSTNDLLREMAGSGAQEGTVLVAREQTGGRGRMGRAWFSPPGGLWWSLLLRPPDPADARIPLTVAVGVAEGVRTACGADVGLKWPNDLILEGRKLGGILVESMPPRVIVGVGINVNMDAPTLPAEIAETATSLSASLGHEIDLDALLRAVLDGVEGAYRMLMAGRGDEVLAHWRRLSVTLGRPVQVQHGAERLHGRAIDIDAAGALLVEPSGGGRTRVIGGDLTVLEGERRP